MLKISLMYLKGFNYVKTAYGLIDNPSLFECHLVQKIKTDQNIKVIIVFKIRKASLS